MNKFEREKMKNLLMNSNVNKMLYSGSGYKFKGLPKEPVYMSDEEVYYVANAVYEMSSKSFQRSVFQMIHCNCDCDTIVRFHQLFLEDDIDSIMISC